MLNISPIYNFSNISTWKEAVSICTYMVCKTAIVITVLILGLALIKYIVNTIINCKKANKRDEFISRNSSNNCNICENMKSTKKDEEQQ